MSKKSSTFQDAGTCGCGCLFCLMLIAGIVMFFGGLGILFVGI